MFFNGAPTPRRIKWPHNYPMINMPGRNLIVIGTSSGGMDVLSGLTAQLPDDLPAAVCIVQHLPQRSANLLSKIIDQESALPAVQAEDGMPLEHGRIYVAPADYHLLVESEHLSLSRGPRENRARPAVDPLFRSAASAYGERVIGVILSGALDDGTSGLASIKRAGGVAVVQDPDEALYPSMPQSALDDYVDVDHALPLEEMGEVLRRLVSPATSASDSSKPMPTHDEKKKTSEPMGTDGASEAKDEDQLAKLTCPECGGPLQVESEEEPRSYRCLVGHRYTTRALLEGQDDAVERALWVALRTLEERGRMLDRMANDAREKGQGKVLEKLEDRARETRAHAETLRALLKNPADTSGNSEETATFRAESSGKPSKHRSAS